MNPVKIYTLLHTWAPPTPSTYLSSTHSLCIPELRPLPLHTWAPPTPSTYLSTTHSLYIPELCPLPLHTWAPPTPSTYLSSAHSLYIPELHPLPLHTWAPPPLYIPELRPLPLHTWAPPTPSIYLTPSTYLSTTHSLYIPELCPLPLHTWAPPTPSRCARLGVCHQHRTKLLSPVRWGWDEDDCMGKRMAGFKRNMHSLKWYYHCYTSGQHTELGLASCSALYTFPMWSVL